MTEAGGSREAPAVSLERATITSEGGATLVYVGATAVALPNALPWLAPATGAGSTAGALGLARVLGSFFTAFFTTYFHSTGNHGVWEWEQGPHRFRRLPDQVYDLVVERRNPNTGAFEFVAMYRVDSNVVIDEQGNPVASIRYDGTIVPAAADAFVPTDPLPGTPPFPAAPPPLERSGGFASEGRADESSLRVPPFTPPRGAVPPQTTFPATDSLGPAIYHSSSNVDPISTDYIDFEGPGDRGKDRYTLNTGVGEIPAQWYTWYDESTRTLHLEDIEINWTRAEGSLPQEAVGIREFLQLVRDDVAAYAKELGAEHVRLQGTRAWDSSAAMPGRDVDITFGVR